MRLVKGCLSLVAGCVVLMLIIGFCAGEGPKVNNNAGSSDSASAPLAMSATDSVRTYF